VFFYSWDDWVPQDRLRKLTDENQELAKNLKKEMDVLRNQNRPAPKSIAGKRRGDGSSRASEERGLAVSGKKRGRDFESERVSNMSRYV
jgi:mortality factor 4-like protein 1